MKGHMGTRRDLANAKYTEWIASAEANLSELHSHCERVIVIGFSMGGLIAVNIAAKHKIDGIITLNSPIYHWDLKRIGKNIVRDLKTTNYKNIKYYIRSMIGIPFSALINFKRLLKKTKPLLKHIRCPIFIAQGLLDDTVHHKSAAYIDKHVSSKAKYLNYYNNTDHFICYGAEFKEVIHDIESFINNACLL